MVTVCGIKYITVIFFFFLFFHLLLESLKFIIVSAMILFSKSLRNTYASLHGQMFTFFPPLTSHLFASAAVSHWAGSAEWCHGSRVTSGSSCPSFCVFFVSPANRNTGPTESCRKLLGAIMRESLNSVICLLEH